MRTNFKTLLMLALMAGVCLLSGMAQQRDPIAKEGLLLSLSRKALSSKELVEQMERRGVDFALTSTDEADIRAKGKYLGKKGLNAVITAVRANYRPDISQKPIASSHLESSAFREKVETVTVTVGEGGRSLTWPMKWLENRRLRAVVCDAGNVVEISRADRRG